MREIVIPLATGIAMFLFGMQLMRIGLFRLSGDYFQRFLYRFTQTPYHGFFSGTVATMFLQSSSAVTVITIGLINANVITFYQSIGIILGTNLGTVVTVQLIALEIGKLSIPMLFMGIILTVIPVKIVRGIGLFLTGFSIIFLGMEALQMISSSIQSSSIVQNMIAIKDHQIIIGILLGTIVTAVIQSSTAMTAMTMSLIYYQDLPLSFGIAVILGSNIGTCFTAILASIGGSIGGKQVATAHILLNIVGVILIFPFIEPFSASVQMLTSYPPAQIAHAQLIFNLISSLLVLPFTNTFAKLTLWLAPKERS